MRVNMNVPDKLVARLDEYAKENYSSRSTVMCQACDQFLSTQEVKKMMGQLTLLIKKVTESGEIDDESRRQLIAFDDICKAFVHDN